MEKYGNIKTIYIYLFSQDIFYIDWFAAPFFLLFLITLYLSELQIRITYGYMIADLLDTSIENIVTQKWYAEMLLHTHGAILSDFTKLSDHGTKISLIKIVDIFLTWRESYKVAENTVTYFKFYFHEKN